MWPKLREARKTMVHSAAKKKREREWVDRSKSMKTCLYLVDIFLSLYTVLLLRFSLAVCDGDSFIFQIRSD